MRKVVKLLATRTNRLNKDADSKVFNIVISAELAQQDHPEGISDNAMKAQWNERKTERYGWPEVMKWPETDEERAEQDVLKGKIVAAAAKLGIDVPTWNAQSDSTA